jgi:hypothetical protein
MELDVLSILQVIYRRLINVVCFWKCFCKGIDPFFVPPLTKRMAGDRLCNVHYLYTAGVKLQRHNDTLKTRRILKLFFS